MPKLVSQVELDAVLSAAAHFPEGGAIEDIGGVLEVKLPRRTLQRRLALLVAQQRLTVEGRGRGSRYRLPSIGGEAHILGVTAKLEAQGEVYVPISPAGEVIKQAIRQPIQNRRPVGYNRVFLDAYRPNDTFYLTPEIRRQLREFGQSPEGRRPAGTYARQVFGRLLIDLSWNSSHLKGNTYSLLETERPLELGEAAEGKDASEAQMILNPRPQLNYSSNRPQRSGSTVTPFSICMPCCRITCSPIRKPADGCGLGRWASPAPSFTHWKARR